MSSSDYEARKERALQRLGCDDPHCIVCGESDWRCLELHHVTGKDYGDDLSTVCRNCHRKLSDAQRDHLAPSGSEVSTLEVIGRFLNGIADLFELCIERFREYASYLIMLGRQEEATP